ncbi:WGR domain-containing protein (plasmid) [Rhodobacter capsulatus]|uniref:WGR domain-containing protein n=1 Tax=Rhodobacter capsulatus TaxID=1061 RepID=UPI0011423FA2|nr:WGR domain-containing protein [Rhodobacter capsulatus]TQD33349.1 WGR domain-containing protein [Rhodobacter capsulatus]
MLDQLVQLEVFPTDLDLRRIDPACNMRRFYRMSVQPDLFGGACLVREWGRIGLRGQMMIEQYDDEGKAVTALMKLSATKTRRGYRAVTAQGTV